MEKVLIIGGCGYIGSRLHQYLLSQGMDITSVDLRWFGSFTNFYSVEQDFSELEKGFLAQFKTVILLAGHSSVKMCASNMRSTFNNNVVNFIALLDKLS